MGLRINNNIAALNSYNNVNRTDKAVSSSLEKLSSGFRINKAADDAAGLVVSEGLRSQIGGMTIAARNAQDGINVAQTADGALGVTTSILQRMRDLAVQASSGGAQDADAQKAANLEFGKLKEELTRITSTTAFGGQKLLDGTYKGVFQVGANAGEQLKVNLTSTALTGAAPTPATKEYNASDIAIGATSKTLTLTTAAGVSESYTVNSTAYANLGALATDISNKAGGKFSASVGTNGNLVLTARAGDDADAAISATYDSAALTAASPRGTVTTFTAASIGMPGAGAASKSFSLTQGTTTFQATLIASDATVNATANPPEFKSLSDLKDAIHATAGFNATINTGGDLVVTSATNSDQAIAVAVAAANVTPSAQVLGVNTPATPVATPGALTGFSAAGLNLATVNLVDGTTPTDISKNVAASQAAINAIDAALKGVGTARATIGASQNRFEYTLSSLNVSIENITASESAIRDTDMAAEMTKFTKNQILSQAGTSMLAQANSSTQNILTLLRG